MNQRRFITTIILIVLAAVAYVVLAQRNLTPYTVSTENLTPTQKPKTDMLMVSLGQEFTLRKNQAAKIATTGLEVTITEFSNSPCPKDVQCFWSGVGIGFEYRFNGSVQRGIDLVKAFGHQTKIAKTDYETFAILIIEEMK